MAHKRRKYKKFSRNLRKEIIDVFRSNPSKPMNYKQVAGALKIKDSALRILIAEIIKEEAAKGNLRRVERGKYKIKAAPRETIEGVIQINRHGRGFVSVEGYDQDIQLAKRDTGTALWGDTVLISFDPQSNRPSAKLVEVLQRARDQYVGVIEMSPGFAFCVPTDQRIHVDFFVPLEHLNGAKKGDKVIVEMDTWKSGSDNPVGHVVEVLGRPGDNEVEMHAIMVEFGLPYEFPPEISAAAEKVPTEVSKEEIKRRKDFRKTLTFTIDPHDAKDFDDALSLQKLKNGNWEVGVHIADVTHYLTPGSVLDQEAFQRATSVYLVDRTVPMLPEILSNQLCSLRPNEDKLCFSAVFELDENAEVKKEWFGKTMIHSDRRFTYEEAQERLETGEGDLADEVTLLDKLAKKLRAKRFEKGGIDFRSEEVKFNLDEEGRPVSVYSKVMKDANRLIEDFMLLANTRVARFIGGASQPKTFVYRVHDTPNTEKLVTLREFVRRFGYRLPNPTDENAASIIRNLLRKIEGTAEGEIIQQLAIRSMAKAEYSTQNLGHFGLAFDFYSHFTSPIRRYPDVMVHRLLEEYLAGGKSADADDYERKCRHASLMERKAQEAEWASIKYKQVEFLLSRIGDHFYGLISGLTRRGIYVEIIENKCEGMVKMDSMRDDYYHFDEDRYMVTGSRTGKEYHLGDKIEIKVIGANMLRRQLDFEIVV